MFKVEFETSTHAFDGEKGGNAANEVLRILNDIADMAHIGVPSGTIKDINGKRIGSWEFTKD